MCLCEQKTEVKLELFHSGIVYMPTVIHMSDVFSDLANYFVYKPVLSHNMDSHSINLLCIYHVSSKQCNNSVDQ